MKQEELMIGDWVRWKEDNSFLCIRCFQSLEGCKLFEPIPITTEILKKNLIDHSEGRYVIQYASADRSFSVSNLTGTGKHWHVNIYNKFGECISFFEFDYVHELQHALRLCRIDKEIEL